MKNYAEVRITSQPRVLRVRYRMDDCVRDSGEVAGGAIAPLAGLKKGGAKMI